MLPLSIAIRCNRFQPRSIRRAHHDADGLCHAKRIARQQPIVNRLNGSEH
jgi:hypothetical protein